MIEQVEKAYVFVLRHINKSGVVEGVYTKRKWEYPVKAIREVIRNAVVHRDYSLSGKDIKIAIYDDMIEITSPGKLLPSIDFDKLYDRQSDVRNKALAPVFKHLGIIDQWGNGLKLIGDELVKFRNIKFEWKEVGMQFQIKFINTLFDNDDKNIAEKTVEKTVEKIVGLLKENSKITVNEISQKTGLSRRGVEWNINKLKEEGKLKRVGHDRGGYWKIIDKK